MSLPFNILIGILREVIRDIIRECKNVYLVILYGSYARGDAGPKSDVDLLIVSGDPRDCEEKAVKIGVKRGLPILQPVALSPDELSDPKKERLYFNALLEGLLLYQSPESEPVKTAPLDYKPYLIIKYRAPPEHRRKLVGTTVVRRGYRVRARGLIEKMGGIRLGPGVFMIEYSKWPPLELIMQKLRVEYEIKHIVLAKRRK
ncbi:MAG: nucleotidyltransferase domain-containing protein [Thermoprotei archaeon]